MTIKAFRYKMQGNTLYRWIDGDYKAWRLGTRYIAQDIAKMHNVPTQDVTTTKTNDGATIFEYVPF